MNFPSLTLAAALMLAGAAHAAETPAKPVRMILVGDSTMANSSGYGDAFCARVNRANTCLNLAKGGRRSGSFRAEGRWDEVEGLLRGAGAYRATYVLIQFGHNDQPGKPGRSTDLKTEFPVNMTHYVQEVKALGHPGAGHAADAPQFHQQGPGKQPAAVGRCGPRDSRRAARRAAGPERRQLRRSAGDGRG